MRINLDCNRPNPQFGMAFKIKGLKFQEHSDKIPQETQAFMEYTNMIKSKAALRGFMQMNRELAPQTHYDVHFNPQDNSMDVVETATKRVVEHFTESPQGVTGLDHFGVYKFPGRKILAYFFNPRLFLPYNVNLAAERATKLEKEAVHKTKIYENLNNEDFLGL